jgi:hypothetical protein
VSPTSVLLTKKIQMLETAGVRVPTAGSNGGRMLQSGVVGWASCRRFKQRLDPNPRATSLTLLATALDPSTAIGNSGWICRHCKLWLEASFEKQLSGIYICLKLRKI